jgi:SPP1 family predicted phage head-tail adaptor
MVHRQLCAGDLDRKISILSRAMVPPANGVDMSMEFTVLKTPWAGLKTAKGKEVFYASNMQDAVTHVFYIRWYDGLETQHWIQYKGVNYDILEIEDLDERNEWYAIYCNVRGSSSLEVNEA